MVLVGCNQEPSQAGKNGEFSEGTTPSGKQVLRLGNGAEPEGLDPQIVTGVPEHFILAALLEGLLSEHPETLSPEPGVADRWEISEDGRRSDGGYSPAGMISGRAGRESSTTPV